MHKWTLSAIVVVVLATPVHAMAQSAPVDTAFDHHSGLMFSFGFGWGTVSSSGCQGCDIPSGVTATGSLGWFLNPRWAVMLDAFAMTTADALPEDDPANLFLGYSAANALGGLGVQYWATPRLWLKGSVGRATLLTATYFGTGEASGGGMTLGAGYELLQKGNFALDLQGRVSHASIQGTDLTSTGILLAVNWH